MRTNVTINDNLINEARELTQLKTTRQIIESALKELIRIKKQQKNLTLEGKLKWEGNLEEMRQGRFISHDGSC